MANEQRRAIILPARSRLGLDRPLPSLRFFGRDRRVVLQRARRRAEERDGRQHDLIDRQAVLAGLDADRLRSGRRRSRPRGPITSTPQPLSCQPQPARPQPLQSSRLYSAAEVDPMRQIGTRRRRRRCRSNWTNTESFPQLFESALPRIQSRYGLAGLGVERELEVVGRAGQRRGQLRGARIGMAQLRRRRPPSRPPQPSSRSRAPGSSAA